MYSAALRSFVVHDPHFDVDMDCVVMYPTLDTESLVQRGPYSFSVAENAPLAGSEHPLVIVSHGSGGSPLTHHNIGSALARAGYVVCMPEHPFNNRRDNSMEGRNAMFQARCLQISACIDKIAGDAFFSSQVLTQKIGYVGHSIGANVGMILVGAQPMPAEEHRAQHGLMLHERADDVYAGELHREPRITAAALFALVPTWFQYPGAMSSVKASLLLLNGERDMFIPLAANKAFVDTSGCAAQVEQRVVTNAGHFSFLCPIDPVVAPRMGPVAQDPPGFDRAVFQHELESELVQLFGRALS